MGLLPQGRRYQHLHVDNARHEFKRSLYQTNTQRRWPHRPQHYDVGRRRTGDFAVGDFVDGVVKSVAQAGVFIDIGTAKDAMLPWELYIGTGDEIDVGDRVVSLVVYKVDTVRDRIILRFWNTPSIVLDASPDRVEEEDLLELDGLTTESEAEEEPMQEWETSSEQESFYNMDDGCFAKRIGKHDEEAELDEFSEREVGSGKRGDDEYQRGFRHSFSSELVARLNNRISKFTPIESDVGYALDRFHRVGAGQGVATSRQYLPPRRREQVHCSVGSYEAGDKVKGVVQWVDAGRGVNVKIQGANKIRRLARIPWNDTLARHYRRFQPGDIFEHLVVSQVDGRDDIVLQGLRPLDIMTCNHFPSTDGKGEDSVLRGSRGVDNVMKLDMPSVISPSVVGGRRAERPTRIHEQIAKGKTKGGAKGQDRGISKFAGGCASSARSEVAAWPSYPEGRHAERPTTIREQSAKGKTKGLAKGKDRGISKFEGEYASARSEVAAWASYPEGMHADRPTAISAQIAKGRTKGGAKGQCRGISQFEGGHSSSAGSEVVALPFYPRGKRAERPNTLRAQSAKGKRKGGTKGWGRGTIESESEHTSSGSKAVDYALDSEGRHAERPNTVRAQIAKGKRKGGAKGWDRGIAKLENCQKSEHASSVGSKVVELPYDSEGEVSCYSDASELRASRQYVRKIEDVRIGESIQGSVVGFSSKGMQIDFGCEVYGIVPVDRVPDLKRTVTATGTLLTTLRVFKVDRMRKIVFLDMVGNDTNQRGEIRQNKQPSSDDLKADDEKRICWNGHAYSKEEFITYFGGTKEWDEAEKARDTREISHHRDTHWRNEGWFNREKIGGNAAFDDRRGTWFNEVMTGGACSSTAMPQPYPALPEGTDIEEARAMLDRIEVNSTVEGVVTSITAAGAYVNFGLPIQGLVPQRCIHWRIQEGDELSELFISHVDTKNLAVVLSPPKVKKVKTERTESIERSGTGRALRGAHNVPGVAGRKRSRGRWIKKRNDNQAPATPDDTIQHNTLVATSQGIDPDISVAQVSLEGVSADIQAILTRISEGDEGAAGDLACALAASPESVAHCATVCAALKVMISKNTCTVAALKAVQELCLKLGRCVEPLTTQVVPAILEKYGDRERSIQDAAIDAAETIIARLNPYGIEAVLPTLLRALRQKEKTDIKTGALQLLALMRDQDVPRPLARNLHTIVPHVAEMILDVKRDVSEAGLEAMMELFECCENNDLAEHTDLILSALTNMEEIPRCIVCLSEMVFVQSVESQALAIVMPLILRGLKGRDELTKRRSLVIADNMCKLVTDVTEIQPFLPTLIPHVEKANSQISDPEVRSVAGRALKTLEQARKADSKRQIDKDRVSTIILERVPTERHGPALSVMVAYVASLCCSLCDCRVFDYPDWWQCMNAYLAPHFLSTQECEDILPALLEYCYDATEGDDAEEDDDDGEDLCNCVFTLGYGSHTLLNNTRLHLKRGKCYGLCGPNNSGKSTLLRAINNEQVKGFPPKSELVTAFVEHGIGDKEPECYWTPLEYVYADETIQAMQIPKKTVRAALKSLGFDERQQKMGIGQLSGGWRMKLGLVRAMLMCADIVLLDEPTGHLDATNVSWLADFVCNSTNDDTRPITTIVVSHDTDFLQKVCTHIIHVKQRKLKTYKGNIDEFVRRVPEASTYIAFDSEQQSFKFPQPVAVEGVKSRGKNLVRARNVTFTYPSSDVPTLVGVSIEVSMLSRVAVIGPNGAGKSTMIKTIIGELPLSGTGNVWKHPDALLSYVAQDTFHHIESHLDKTATQYMLWRFRGGNDREALENRAESDNESQKKQYYLKNGQLAKCQNEADAKKAVGLEAIYGRKKSKARGGTGDEKYEYLVKWNSDTFADSMWVEREKLIDMGHSRMVHQEDLRQAAEQGFVVRPLTQPDVEDHFAGFGLDATFASHQRLGVLSAGQKVKVILAAATWLAPHILILDEPTNFLDRDSLGALVAGLKEFEGGVIVISHNREFADLVCDERWIMNGGRLTREVVLDKDDVKTEKSMAETEYGEELGNRIVFEKKKSMMANDHTKYAKQQEDHGMCGEGDIEQEDDWYEKLLEQALKACTGYDTMDLEDASSAAQSQ